MALAYPHIKMFCLLRQAGVLGGDKTRSILEFGEQNWFGDVHPKEIYGLIEEHCDDNGQKQELKERLGNLLSSPTEAETLFEIAKLFYKIILNYDVYSAVDLHGTSNSKRCDLNVPLPFQDQFDVTTNLGTAEHVFNQYQFFRSMHEKTKPGGIMIHSFPNQGCYDHGFYNYHPTFVFDICKSNHYELVSFILLDGSNGKDTLINIPDRAAYVKLAVENRLGNYSGLMAVLRKADNDLMFETPRQGYYDNSLPPDLAEAWRKLPR